MECGPGRQAAGLVGTRKAAAKTRNTLHLNRIEAGKCWIKRAGPSLIPVWGLIPGPLHLHLFNLYHGSKTAPLCQGDALAQLC